MIEGKNEEMSTSELSGGARIHYIFQSIFVKSLEVCIRVCCLLFWSFFLLDIHVSIIFAAVLVKYEFASYALKTLTYLSHMLLSHKDIGSRFFNFK